MTAARDGGRVPLGRRADVLRVGNASGFYGDRFEAVHEMLTGGPLDVLTGDYLAELTMLILGCDRLKDPRLGYAKTFLRQLEDTLGTAHERDVRIVTNAGGLNPAGLADAVRALAGRLGIPVQVAHVEGDDVSARFPDALTAHAYLGGAGIAACLRAGADIVVTGRVTDAALVTGPAAAHFGWGPKEYDRLAGAVVAGHVLECGTQATGGNYAFFSGHDVRRPGFPLAEIHADGTAVVTKHDGTGGIVDIGTVTAQLLYETGGARYAGPDVTARLDTVRLEEDGPDRVRISGVRGEAPPSTLKVGLNRIGGWRNEVVFVLTGLDVEAKARLVREQLQDALGKQRPAEVRWELARTDSADADTEERASAYLRLVVRDPDAERVGRAVSGAAIELALGSYPGFHVTAPPGKGAPYGVFDAVYVPAETVPHTAVLPDGERVHLSTADDVPPTVPARDAPGSHDRPDGHPQGASAPAAVAAGDATAGGPEDTDTDTDTEGGGTPGRASDASDGFVDRADGGPCGTPGHAPDASGGLVDPADGGPALPEPLPPGPTRRAPLGLVMGARSGDKGGDANIGVWARTEDAWRWLAHELTVERLRVLLPETDGLLVVRHVLPNLRALNFVVGSILGEGVASQARFDPQAKALGEWLRARYADIPEALL
ncbi:acyclic terpene utilization AtuA family protein [Streptomyces sp. NPDC018833]|uniref:acyclic terpene utilization AtuA family protein n=1 Tax=Streptomyces sp. NPDC018833 TaxID=3365053 RepID=UPI0037B3EDC3